MKPTKAKALLASLLVASLWPVVASAQMPLPDLVKRADVNGDGAVATADATLVRAQVGKACGQTGYSPTLDVWPLPTPGSFGGDCRITIDDYNFVTRLVG